MEPLKKHGDPLEDEIKETSPVSVDEVKSNQPGSKGRRGEAGEPIVRSADQTPNPNQPDNDATVPPDGIRDERPSNM
jgi:hypothetical protein